MTMHLELTEWNAPTSSRYPVFRGDGSGNDDNRRTFQPVAGGTRRIGTTEIPPTRPDRLLDRLQLLFVRALIAQAMSRLPAAAARAEACQT